MCYYLHIIIIIISLLLINYNIQSHTNLESNFKYWTHHFFGMLFTEWCLVGDVEDRDGALLTICKFGCATSKELL